MNKSEPSPDAGTAARSRLFDALYAEHYARVLGYVPRRTEGADDAADVIAETFLVAWRRLEDAPTGDRARLWLRATHDPPVQERRDRLMSPGSPDVARSARQMAAPPENRHTSATGASPARADDPILTRGNI